MKSGPVLLSCINRRRRGDAPGLSRPQMGAESIIRQEPLDCARVHCWTLWQALRSELQEIGTSRMKASVFDSTFLKLLRLRSVIVALAIVGALLLSLVGLLLPAESDACSERGLARWIRRFARRCSSRVLVAAVLAVCPMVVGGGLGANGSGSAGLSVGHVGESGASGVVWSGHERLDGDAVHDRSVAPEWPFRGVVNYVSRRVVSDDASGDLGWRYWSADTGEWDRDFLQFWDVESGRLHEVPMGRTLPACYTFPLVYDDYVELQTWEDVVFRVPWGDDAYPHLVTTETVSDPYGGHGPFLDGDLELSYSDERLRVATAAGEAFYATWWSDAYPLDAPRAGSGDKGLFVSDADSGEAMHPEDEMHWASVAEFDGSDGRHYGLSVNRAEPACWAEDSYIVAGDTGEVVACGSRYGGGPRLFEPEGSRQRPRVLALPQSTVGMDCDEPLDLRVLAARHGAAESTLGAARTEATDEDALELVGSAGGLREVR